MPILNKSGTINMNKHVKFIKNPYMKRLFRVTTVKLQEGLAESKLKREPIHIDRPQTDNLLITPDNSLITEEKLANQSKTKYQTKDVSVKEIQNVEELAKSKLLTDPRLHDTATIKWEPDEDKQLLTTRKTEHAISFDEVPGPISLRFLSKVTKTLPAIGMQTISRLMHGINHLILSYGNIVLMPRDVISPFMRLFDTYGDVVCLRIPLCGDVVVVQKPEHITEIYKQKNLNKLSYSSFDSLTEWHKRQAKRRFDVGLGLTPELKELFKDNYNTQKIFWSNTKYHGSIEKATNDFVDRIYSIRNMHNEVSADFHKELYTWGIECMMQTLFGTNLGFYKANDMQTNVEAQRTLQSLIDATDALQKCESGLQLWRLFNTRSWDKLSSSCEVLESVMAKHIRMSKLRLDIAVKMMMENKDYKDSAQVIKSSLVKALILAGCIQPEQILTLCLDMMILGVNAASTSLGFTFYHLSKCREKQQKLFNEILHILPQKNSVLQLENLQETPYLHACITESLRLKHPIPYSLMRLTQNMVINKYYIPAGTYVMTANEVSCLNEENFDDAAKFKPERWLNHVTGSLQDVVVPLSEGTRSFLGRDWLHQQLAVATAKIIRHFKIEYFYGEIKTNRKILSKPTKPFKFVFEERRA